MGATEHRRALLWGWGGARQARALLGDWLAGGTQALLTRAWPEDPSLGWGGGRGTSSTGGRAASHCPCPLPSSPDAAGGASLSFWKERVGL